MYDIWFARKGDAVWFVWAEPGEPPHVAPIRADNVSKAFRWLEKAGIKIGQVGIADGDMLGLS